MFSLVKPTTPATNSAPIRMATSPLCRREKRMIASIGPETRSDLAGADGAGDEQGAGGGDLVARPQAVEHLDQPAGAAAQAHLLQHQGVIRPCQPHVGAL